MSIFLQFLFLSRYSIKACLTSLERALYEEGYFALAYFYN